MGKKLYQNLQQLNPIFINKIIIKIIILFIKIKKRYIDIYKNINIIFFSIL